MTTTREERKRRRRGRREWEMQLAGLCGAALAAAAALRQHATMAVCPRPLWPL